MPVWVEPSFLTNAATAGNLTITVDDTTLGDYRVGGLVIVLIDRFTSDSLEIESITSTTITLTSPLNFSYDIGTPVYPLRTCVATGSIRGSRAVVNDADLNILFRVDDNNVGSDFGDTSAFNTLDSKVLLDGPNAVGIRMTEILNRRLVEYDNEIGKLSVTSPWNSYRRSSVKGFITHGRQELWEVRKLLHALSGRQKSFYLPTFFDELVLTVKLQSGSQTMNVENVGFAQFAQAQSPSRSILRVIETDGTIHTRDIESAAEVDAENEQLVVDTSWPNDIEIVDIKRIEYVELVRIDTDRITISHLNAFGEAEITFPVKAVFE